MIEFDSKSVQWLQRTFHLVFITNYPTNTSKINFQREFDYQGQTYRVSIIEKSSDRNNTYFIHEGNEIKFAITKPENNPTATPFVFTERDFAVFQEIVTRLNTWLGGQ